MKTRLVIALVLIATLFVTRSVSAQEFSGVRLITSLSGSEERPGPGDPDGSGFAVIRLNYGQSQVCWDLSYADIGTPIAAHIHSAPAGVPGPVVVPLNALSPGCSTVSQELIKAIIQNPDQYYVNIHTAVYPAGAIRGQLSNPGLSD